MNDEAVIIIAEDDAGHFALVKKNLWRSCVHNDILHFKDGEEVLNFLFMRNEDGPNRIPGSPYLLLLDIRMPKVDGVEVLKQIKDDPELCMMPVVMLTTTDDAKEVERCYNNGCSFYMVKPANYNDFMQSVEQLGMFLSLNSVKVPKIGSSGE